MVGLNFFEQFANISINEKKIKIENEIENKSDKKNENYKKIENEKVFIKFEHGKHVQITKGFYKGYCGFVYDKKEAIYYIGQDFYEYTNCQNDKKDKKIGDFITTIRGMWFIKDIIPEMYKVIVLGVPNEIILNLPKNCFIKNEKTIKIVNNDYNNDFIGKNCEILDETNEQFLLQKIKIVKGNKNDKMDKMMILKQENEKLLVFIDAINKKMYFDTTDIFFVDVKLKNENYQVVSITNENYTLMNLKNELIEIKKGDINIKFMPGFVSFEKIQENIKTENTENNLLFDNEPEIPEIMDIDEDEENLNYDLVQDGGDNEQGDNEQGDNEQGDQGLCGNDNEQGDQEHVEEQEMKDSFKDLYNCMFSNV